MAGPFVPGAVLGASTVYRPAFFLPQVVVVPAQLLVATPTSYVRSITETIAAVSDSVNSRVFTGGRAISESIAGATDSPTRVFTGARGLSETVAAATDTVGRVTTYAPAPSETVAPARHTCRPPTTPAS